MTPPTSEQLDHLIGHTANRALTPDEHAALRDGVRSLRDHAGQDARSMLLNLPAGWGMRPGNGARDIVDEALRRHAAELRDRAEQAEARIAAIRELHQPVDGLGYHEDGSYEGDRLACRTCGTPDEYATWWPCPTIRALDDTAALAQAQP